MCECVCTCVRVLIYLCLHVGTWVPFLGGGGEEEKEYENACRSALVCVFKTLDYFVNDKMCIMSAMRCYRRHHFNHFLTLFTYQVCKYHFPSVSYFVCLNICT